MRTHTLAVLLAVAGIGTLPCHADDEHRMAVGSWTTLITITGRPAGPITGLMNVHSDRTVLYSDTSQVAPGKVGPAPADIIYQSAYFGAWERTDTGYFLKAMQFVASPDSSLFGGCTLTMSIKLSDDGNSFSGTATQTCADAKGQPAGPPQTVPFSGKRISTN